MARFTCPAPNCPFDTTSRRALNTHIAFGKEERDENVKAHHCPDCQHDFCTKQQYIRHYPYACRTYKRLRRERRAANARNRSVDVDEIMSALKDFKLKVPHFHELSIHCPVMELIPHGMLPCLEPPKDVELRERPEAKDYAAALDSTDLDFVTAFSVITGWLSGKAPAARFGLDLAASITRLSEAPGSSMLEVLRYTDRSHHNLGYIVKLTTDWKTSKGWVREETSFELDTDDWAIALEIGKCDDWTKYLRNLMQRESVAACLHVREILAEYGNEVEEEASWEDDWADEDLVLKTAEQLLCERLWRIDDDGIIDIGYVENFAELDENEDTVYFALQCNHIRTLSRERLLYASYEGLLAMRCNEAFCGKRAFTDEDEILMACHAAEKRRRATYIDEQHCQERTKAFQAAGKSTVQKQSFVDTYHTLQEVSGTILKDLVQRMDLESTPYISLKIRRFVSAWMWRAAAEAHRESEAKTWKDVKGMEAILQDLGMMDVDS